MKNILTLAFALLLTGAQAQQTCCSATADFADLGKDNRFMMEHQLPKSSVNANQAGEMVEFPTASGQAGRAYLVNAINPGGDYLFVFHEWWGLNENIMAEADQWAQSLEGINILAIDLYDGKSATTREGATELMQGAKEERIREIIQGAANYAGTEANIATMGWCFGGGWSMQAAIMLGDRAVASVIYYGMPEKSVEKLANLQAPVLGIFAEKDQWINRAAVAEYEKAMTAAGKKFESHWYNADHAFANPSNAIFDGNAAADAKTKVTKFLYGALIR